MSDILKSRIHKSLSSLQEYLRKYCQGSGVDELRSKLSELSDKNESTDIEKALTQLNSLESQISEVLLLDPKVLSEQFYKSISPYLFDSEMIERSYTSYTQNTVLDTDASFKCRRTDALIRAFFKYSQFIEKPKNAESAFINLIEVFEENYKSFSLDKQLEALGTRFCKAQNVTSHIKYFTMLLGAFVLIKYVMESTATTFDHIPESAGKFLDTVRKKLSTLYNTSSVPKSRAKNAENRLRFILSFNDFSLNSYIDVTFSSADLGSFSNDTNKLTERILASEYQSLLDIINVANKDIEVNSSEQRQRMSLLLNRMTLATFNRWIEVNHPALRSNVTSIHTNGKAKAIWLMRVHKEPDLDTCINEFNADTPDEKVKGQYWGGNFESKQIRPMIVRLHLDKEPIYKSLFMSNMEKVIKKAEAQSGENSYEYDSLLEFLYYTKIDCIHPLTRAYHYYHASEKNLTILELLFISASKILNKQQKDDLRDALINIPSDIVCDGFPKGDEAFYIEKNLNNMSVEKFIAELEKGNLRRDI